MRGLRANVDGARPALQLIHELRERFPTPSSRPAASTDWEFLDAFHQVHQRLAVMLLTGAKPTPQLPNITVVTPCQHDGVSSGSHNAWPS